MPTSDELKEEIAQTRARIDQDIEALQSKLRQDVSPTTVVERYKMPLVAGAVGAASALALLFWRSRDEEEEELYAAPTVVTAPPLHLEDEEARRLLITLLTAQGLRWLQSYLQEHKAEIEGEVEAKMEAEMRAAAPNSPLA